MHHMSYRQLIDRGRKAGLGTAELYQAMATHRSAGPGHLPGGADGNGFVPELNHQGQRVYRPAAGYGRP